MLTRQVLLFTTASFAKPVTVFGSIDVVLYVSSNCTDTDFTVKARVFAV